MKKSFILPLRKVPVLSAILALLFASCGPRQEARRPEQVKTVTETPHMKEMEKKIARYAEVELKADLSGLSENRKRMLILLIDAADLMNGVFWQEAYGDKDSLMRRIPDSLTRLYAEINYGPWDRLDNNKPFVPGVGPKPKGANFYPHDMTPEEFEKADLPDKTSLYTLIRRDSAGRLITVPYSVAFADAHSKAASLLEEAARLAEDQGFKKYLLARARALRTDDYRPSDMLWMDMKTNVLDIVIGPIETYEDQLFGYKAAHEGFVLIKDTAWSRRLEKYTALLPRLQEGLPVDPRYKREKPGSRSDLGAYDAVYYAGDANAGAKTIAINLPNDEEVQLRKGSRRLQLKNVMRAKFDKILVPISEVIIDSAQRKHVKFDAFFENTMFHEVAHGLGIKHTVTGKGPVRTALKDLYSTVEEGKADILGLYMIFKLKDWGLVDLDEKDYMTTFLAGIFRSIRFGASSAHGRANLVRFNFFKEKGAFVRNPDGTYAVDYDKMKEAVEELSRIILTLQGDGDYESTRLFWEKYARIDGELEDALRRINEASIPVDIRFKQGKEVLGL